MKDNLFEMLLNLFEKSLTQLQESHSSVNQESLMELNEGDETLHIQSSQYESIRVLTYEEQMKLTKASYQFLMRMKLWHVIDADFFELTMNQLHCSQSRIVTLQETKWTIRSILATHLNQEQLAFLDMVLYQKEDDYQVH